MNETDFKLHLEKEGWSDAEDEDNSESLTFGKLLEVIISCIF